MKLVVVREEDTENRVRWRQMMAVAAPEGSMQKVKKRRVTES